MQSTGNGPFGYTLGGYYLDDEVPDAFLSERIHGYSTAGALAGAAGTGSYPLYFGSNFTTLPSSGGAVVNPPSTAFIGLNGSDAFNPKSWAKNVSYAAFAQLSYTFADRLTVTGGLRYTIDEKDLRSALATPGVFAGAGTYIAYLPNTDFNHTCDGITAADAAADQRVTHRVVIDGVIGVDDANKVIARREWITHTHRQYMTHGIRAGALS